MQIGVVIVAGPKCRQGLKNRRGAKGTAIKQFDRGGLERTAYQRQTGIGRAAKAGVVIVAHAGAQAQKVGDGQLILSVKRPDNGISPLRVEEVSGSGVIALVLPDVVENLR